jgi:GntR family transcriptional regulator
MSPGGAIDRGSPVPFHFQLRKLLEGEIERQRWPESQQLPSESFFSEHYGVSRATVRQALLALEQQGLIFKRKGKGSFVVRSSSGSWLLQATGGLFDDELSRRGLMVESQVLRATTEPLPEWAAKHLKVDPGSAGVTLERLRGIDGKLTVYVVDHLPEEFAGVLPTLEKDPMASLYGTLRLRYGVEAAGSERVFEAAPAGQLLGRRLGVHIHFPLIVIESVVWDATSKRIDCCRAWVRTDRLRLAVHA